MAEWWGKYDLHVYGKQEDVLGICKEKSIIILNHYSDVDWLSSYVFCERMDCLERTKVLLKDVVKYVPVIGWCWWFDGMGFLKRNWKTDKESLDTIIDNLKKSKMPYKIALFCEGTRRTEDKLRASQEYAKQKNIEPLKHHLIPRTKGFSVIAKNLKDDVDAVYDVEFAFPNIEGANIPNIIARGTVEAHVIIRRIPISEVPCDTEEDASKYLMELYKVKDKHLDYFEKNGEFPAPKVPILRKADNFINFAIANVVVGVLYWTVVKLFVNLYGLSTVAICMTVCGIILFMLVGLCVVLTQSNRGSSFGLKSKKKE